LKMYTQFCVVSRSRLVTLCHHYPRYLHDVVLNYLSTGISLPFLFTVASQHPRILIQSAQMCQIFCRIYLCHKNGPQNGVHKQK
jgi:hypothetical protein